MIDFGHDILRPVILSLTFTIVGVALFAASLWILDKITPFSIHKEIEEDQNVALGIIVGALILGVAIILAASLIDLNVSFPEVPAPAEK